MGRQLRRVALDFNWPIDKTYDGFLNPHYSAEECVVCGGSGSSPYSKMLNNQWYSHLGGIKEVPAYSEPHLPTDPHVIAYATRQCERTPSFYGNSPEAIAREAQRLSRLWNTALSHHLNDDDVMALVKDGRLMDFTHTWSREHGWKPKDPPYVPTAREVNIWSCVSMGHDSINSWVVIRHRCKEAGKETSCPHCDGEGAIWRSQEAKERYEKWEPSEPPEGPGWQLWETVSEGSPITPVFATPEELARYLSGRAWGADRGTPYETWMKFLLGDGWAPSAIGMAGAVLPGVEGVVALHDEYDG